MKIKWSKSFIVTIVVLIIVGAYLWRHWEQRSHAPVMQVAPEQSGAAEYVHRYQSNAPPVATNSPAPLQNPNKAPHDLGLRERANEMSEAEKIEMTNTFVTKLKPAAEKWALVYSNRVPFNLEDLTMDKFVERFGRDSKVFHSYTFVMGDITFSIVEQNGVTQVQYLSSKRAVTTMSTLPTTGAAPDVSMPVTRQDVKAMAEADSGQQFPPNLVQLTPSAESGSFAGGAIVNVGSAVKNAMGIPISKASGGFNYVFAKDGTLAYYLRAH
jgi:hypothetical protein